MKYRDILGFSKKKVKEKRISKSKKSNKPSIVQSLSNQFGPLNERTEKPSGDKRWSGAFSNDDSGLTEFERKGGKDKVNEGPAYEYDKYLSAIEKNYKNYWKSVTNFADVLHNKGFQKEAKVVERAYIKNVKVGFKLFLEKVVRKLM